MISDSSDRSAFALFVAVVAAYLVHAVYATIAHRGLYGDSALFFIKILSEGRVTAIYNDFFRDLHYSRIVAYAITQLPMVVAAQMGLQNIDVLSWIFGAAFFLHKPLSLWVCYRLLPKGRKIFIVFPVLGLFAGSINSELYIVSEAHIALSFLWPLLLAFSEGNVSGRWSVAVLSVAVLLTGLMYESLAFFAPVLLCVTLVRAFHASPADRRKLLFLSALLAVIGVSNAMGIIWPRDPANKEVFKVGLLDLLHDTERGRPHYHMGPTISVLGTLAVGIALFLRGGRNVFERLTLFAAALFFIWAPQSHFRRYWADVWFTHSVGDRGFSILLMPLLFMAGFFAIRRFGMARLHKNAVPICVLIAALAIGQAAWQVLATREWDRGVGAVRRELAVQRGPLYCSKSGWDGFTKDQLLAKRILCEWWIPYLSIFLAPNQRVQALMISSDGLPSWALDPRDPATFPSMKFAPVDYSAYIP